SDFRIDQLGAQRLEALERAFLVSLHQPRIPRHVGGEDRGKAAGGAHSSGSPALRRPSTKTANNSDDMNLPITSLRAVTVDNPGFSAQKRLTYSFPSSTRPSWPQADAFIPTTAVIRGWACSARSAHSIASS